MIHMTSFTILYCWRIRRWILRKYQIKVVKVLESRHQSAGEDYYQVQSFQDIMKTMNSMMGVVTAFISCVAGISLLVGGIGVMNIVLVSVTERNRRTHSILLLIM